MFDITPQVIDSKVNPVGDHLELQFVMGLLIPTGEGLMPLPAGVIRVPFGREASLKIGKELVEEGEKLPKPSQIQVAQNLSGVENTAKNVVNMESKLKGGS